VHEIQKSIDFKACGNFNRLAAERQDDVINEIARVNVMRMVEQIPEQSPTIARLLREKRVAVVGAMYDVVTGNITFLAESEFDQLSDVGTVDSAS
jgi:carbonic anhydrase